MGKKKESHMLNIVVWEREASNTTFCIAVYSAIHNTGTYSGINYIYPTDTSERIPLVRTDSLSASLVCAANSPREDDVYNV